MKRKIKTEVGILEQNGNVNYSLRDFEVNNLPEDEQEYFTTEFCGQFCYVMSELPDAEYIIELGMCEGCYTGEGQRVFDVFINNSMVLRKFDIIKEAKEPHLAVIRRFKVKPRGGKIEIGFSPRRDNASLSRLRVYDDKERLIAEDSVFNCLGDYPADNFGDKGIVLHMIGNAHLDPIWQWRWTEGCAEAVATMQSALERMKEYPDFKFSCSSALYFSWLEGIAPEMIEEIRKRVAEGRWEVVGGWWVQPDCNLPSGESFCRQSLYGQRYFEKVLGRRATAGYNVDSFGHAGTLPQILLESGLNSYVFMRPGPSEKQLPADQFWWQGQDGSKILACRLQTYVCGVDNASLRAVFSMNYPGKHRPFFYGVGNHGGGPTKQAIEKVYEFQKSANYPTLEMSATKTLFDNMRKSDVEFPVLKDELQHHSPGCYTTHSEVKKLNRQAEAALMTAERFAVIAGVTDCQKEIESLWREVMMWQFHDSMGGTCVFDAQQDMVMALSGVVYSAEKLLNRSVRQIAAKVDTGGEGIPFFVFNPLPWPRHELFRAHFFGGVTKGTVVDHDGKALLTNVKLHDAVNYVSFIADVPALGYRLYRFLPDKSGPQATDLEVDGDTISNKNLLFRIDEHSGTLVELVHKGWDINLCSGRANVGLVLEDPDDAWGHNTKRWDREIGRFMAESVKVTETGPAAANLRVTSRYGNSKVIFDFSLGAGCGLIDVNLRLDWREPRSMLKLIFPLALKDISLTSESPYGYQPRPLNGTEEYSHKWIDLSGTTPNGQAGLALLNNAKYGFDAKDNTLRLTVCRSPLYVGSNDRYVDIGTQEFRYQLLPHAGIWQEANIPRRAYELSQPLFVVYDHCHRGNLPVVNSFVSLEKSSILMMVLKRPESGDGFVVRCYESAGKDAEGILELPFCHGKWKINLKPHEIATFKVPASGKGILERVNILEENKKPGKKWRI